MTHPRLRGKRMWAVVMALVLALSVAACGEKKDEVVGQRQQPHPARTAERSC